MNGMYRLPGNWTKDTTIIVGFSAAIILTIVANRFYVIPWYGSIIVILLFLGMAVRARRCSMY